MSVADVLKEVILLTANVQSLKTDMQALKNMVLDHHERIIRLEGGAELTAEKAKTAALGAVSTVTYQLQKEMATIQANQVALPKPKGGGE
jgi:flagellar hook-length control protein FliK